MVGAKTAGEKQALALERKVAYRKALEKRKKRDKRLKEQKRNPHTKWK